MSEVSLSVLIPTMGVRTTLQRAIDSAEGADEVLVDWNDDNDYGYASRTRLMARAGGTHLCFLDDDDVYLEGAIAAFRAQAVAEPGRVALFQMRFPGVNGGPSWVLWKDRIIRHGNVGTPMFLVPNRPELLGRWRPHMEGAAGGGDYAFIAETVGLQGPPAWIPEVVAVIRP